VKVFAYAAGIAAGIFGAWTLAASWLYAAMASVPFNCWFYYARPWPKEFLWSGLGLCVAGILPAFLFSLIGWALVRDRLRRKLRRPFGGGLKEIEAGVTDNHGHAHWPTIRQMLKRFSGPSPDHGGIVIGEARRIDLEPVKNIQFKSNDPSTWGLGGKADLLIDNCESDSPHSMMFVGTGGNKTTSMIGTQIHWLGSMVIFDPSCEIGPMAKRYRRTCGRSSMV
jgi:type IV secretion system protein VirD4